MANSESRAIANAVKTWLAESLPSVGSHSSNTSSSYITSITLFFTFLADVQGIRPPDLCADVFSAEKIEAWLNWLSNERGCCANTCNNRLSSLRSFLKHLQKKDARFCKVYIESLDIKQRHVQKKKPQSLTKEAVKAILAVPNLKTAKGRRDLALILLLYSLGARIGEVLSLTGSRLHLDTDKPYACLDGKGDKPRVAYFMPRTATVLKRYINEYHPDGLGPDDLVFFSDYGGSRHQLSQDAVNKNLREYAKIAHEKCAEVPLDLHAHILRHARASHWLEEGLNIVIIKELLGHEQLNTTMAYIGVSKEQMCQALEKLQDEEEKTIPKQWKDQNGNMSSRLKAFVGLK